MIRPIDINLNAAHPELPLVEATTFTGAPSSVFIRGVPKSVGNWSITAVNVAVTYPDNSTTTRAAVESAEGVWVATIPGTATSGRTVAGFRILADGIDENGAAVTGYVLGFADFAVLSFFPVPAPGETFFYLRYFDTMPTAAKKMDVTTIDGILKYYNGTTWLPFAAYDNTVTPTSANGVKSSGIWSAIWGELSALPTGVTSLYDWSVAQLAGKLSLSGGTMTGEINLESNQLHNSQGQLDQYIGPGYVYINTDGDHTHSPEFQIFFPWKEGTFALLQDIAPNFSVSSTYALNALCVYEGVLYICSTAVTTAGAWTGSTNWTEASVEDVLAALRTALAGKADASAIRYNLDSQSSTAFDDREVQPLALSAASTAVTLPALTSGKVADFIVDVTNGTASDAAIELTGWGTTYSVMIDKGMNAGDLLTFAAGDKARLYFTLTAFTDTINNATVPVWQLSRKDVEIATANGGN